MATATAVMALRMMALRKQNPDAPIETLVDRPLPPITSRPVRSLIERGVEWLAAHQNADGGWGDTIKSVSNISTAMLVRAVLQPSDLRAKYVEVVEAADRYIERAGGIDAVIRRYGKDKTFSIPILTHCALAGLVDWRTITALPFELAWIPPRFYKTVRLPVVSYALPALIAIGQARFHIAPPRNPLLRFLRAGD